MYKKVMVIDDNEIDLYIARRVMEKLLFSEEIILMRSANDALVYLTSNVQNSETLPDLVFLDINMPQMNGFEFLEAYSKFSDDIKKNCIIMMLTTSLHSDDMAKALKSPYVRNYLNKPLNQEKLNTLRLATLIIV